MLKVVVSTLALACLGGVAHAQDLVHHPISPTFGGNPLACAVGNAVLDLMLAGDVEAAAAEHRRLLPLFKGLFVIANPIPVKYCLNRAGFDVGRPRLPLVEADPKTASFLDDLMARYEVDLPTTVSAA